MKKILVIDCNKTETDIFIEKITENCKAYGIPIKIVRVPPNLDHILRGLSRADDMLWIGELQKFSEMDMFVFFRWYQKIKKWHNYSYFGASHITYIGTSYNDFEVAFKQANEQIHKSYFE